jgi:hypothetical protein
MAGGNPAYSIAASTNSDFAEVDFAKVDLA